jgi:site-specific DNA-methyltransferase (adenine-specific)
VPLAYGNQAQAEVKRGNLEHSGKSGINTVKMRGNNHPTVKPLALMRYLCRLVTPPGGVVLDPFTGSGSTGVAAMREGFGFIGIELKPEYASIANARLLAEVLS